MIVELSPLKFSDRTFSILLNSGNVFFRILQASARYCMPAMDGQWWSSRIVSVRTDRLLNKHHASSINALIKTEVGSCFVLVVHSVCDEPALLAQGLLNTPLVPTLTMRELRRWQSVAGMSPQRHCSIEQNRCIRTLECLHNFTIYVYIYI